jgi:YD repeat-containing protein
MEITYSYPGGSLYLKQLPEEIEVKDANGELLRRRRGYYDTYGNLNGLRQYWDNHDDYGEYELSYNKYGNLTGITDPGGYTLEYSYDTEVSTYVTRITTYNSLHYETEYTSTMEWDYRYGVETASEDLNGNRQEKEYDSFGRISSIRTPYDTGATTALSYEYRTGDYPWKAITDNKLHFDPTNTETMETVVTIDGLGRIIQTAKEGEVYAETGSRYGWNRSGAVVFDAKARPVQEGQTVFEESDENPTLTPLIRPTLKEYDILDRVVKVTLPDGALMLMDYRIESSRFIEITTDPEGNITETVKDVRGNTVEVRRKNSTGELLNRAAYNYNGLGEMITVTDYEGNEVTFQYDLLGRRLNVNSPDAGLIEYEYDEVGNIIRKVDSNLRNRGESIYYEYDGHNRLVTVDYPRMGDVNYTYGDGNTPGNGAGRLLQITDESGIITYGYGKLGETVTINRQLHRLAPLGGNKEAGLEYTYDYLGRMERIIYPDGEEVTYEYDHGGQVTKVTGERNGQETEYIEQIGYDEYGQRVYIRYGNGVETTYTYDENRRWLDNISTENQYGNSYQEINYQFDTVGNILRMENNAEKYYSLQEYTYDDQYQLTLAEGLYESKPYGSVDFTNRYTQEFTFDRIGNITNKVSEQVYNPTRPHPGQLNYNLEYRYYEGKPHQAEQIGKLWYLYDGNGNIIEEREGGHSPEGISGSGETPQSTISTMLEERGP